MGGRMVHCQHKPVLAAIVIAGSFLIAQPAFAQSDGDEQCGKKGTTLMFDALAKSWVPTNRSCVLAGAGAPANGDKRCGFAGYVLTYDAKRNVWRASQEHCDGSQSYIGFHKLD